jgi:phosphate-selective porin OprO/OprP
MPEAQRDPLQDDSLYEEPERVKKIKYVKKRPYRHRYEKYLRPFRGKLGKPSWDYRYRFGGQISYDIAYIDEAGDQRWERAFRRFRVNHGGSFFDEKLFYELEYSFTGVNHFKDLYVGYQNEMPSLGLYYRLKAGNLKIPFSLEGYTSSKYLTFMERSLSEAYAENRKLGAEVLLSKRLEGQRVNLFMHAFGNSVDERLDDDKNHPGAGGRLTWTVGKKRHLLMGGGAYIRQDWRGDKIRISQSVESDLSDHKFVSVKIKNVDTLERSNLELLYMYHRLCLQGEYTRIDVSAKKGDYAFDGYYVQASYFLRGDGREFKRKTSKFGRIAPKGRWGDWEVAFRYAFIDLNDKDEHGGRQTDYTFGLNWYITRELRWMFNYVLAYPDDTDTYDGMLQVFETRMLFSF